MLSEQQKIDLRAIEQSISALMEKLSDAEAVAQSVPQLAPAPGGEQDLIQEDVADATAGVYSKLQALRDLHKTFQVTATLARNATSDEEADKHFAEVQALNAEIQDLATQVIEAGAAIYAPLTEAFIAAAESLKQTHQKAKSLAGQLKFATGLIEAFGRIVAVI